MTLIIDEHEHVLHTYTPHFHAFQPLLDIIAFTGASYSLAFIYILFFTSPHVMCYTYGHMAHSRSHYGTCTSLLSTFLVFPFTFGQAPQHITGHGFLSNPSTRRSHVTSTVT